MSAPKRQHGREVTELQKSCRSKRRFPDELTARAGAQIECDHGNTRKGAMWIYTCSTCRGWHITNKSNGRRWMVTTEELFAPDPFADLAEKP